MLSLTVNCGRVITDRIEQLWHKMIRQEPDVQHHDTMQEHAESDVDLWHRFCRRG